MAIFINTTRVITNTPSVDWAKFIDTPTQFIKNLVITASGDNTNVQGSSGTRVNTVSYSSANSTLSVNFDTNCTSACACACNCGG